jgi:hypothetical protein
VPANLGLSEGDVLLKFTLYYWFCGRNDAHRFVSAGRNAWRQIMGALALAIFIGVYMLGTSSMNLGSERSEVQLFLFLSFILGIICGYRTSR